MGNAQFYGEGREILGFSTVFCAVAGLPSEHRNFQSMHPDTATMAADALRHYHIDPRAKQ